VSVRATARRYGRLIGIAVSVSWFSGPGCGGSSGGGPPTTPATPPPLRNGCESLTSAIARPGDNIGGDTFQNFAGPFFITWCTRCHSSRLTTPEERTGAPQEFNWDVEATVRANLGRIRVQIGVENSMPLNDPRPSCEERRRLVRWIDAGAP
jgi:hypothetical protein